jgi:hypothetical protein
LDGFHRKFGILVTTSDDLTAEHLEMVAVALQGFSGKSVLQQAHDEGLQGFEQALSNGDILGLGLPQTRPVRPIRTKLIERQRLNWNNRSVLTSPRSGCHALRARAQCVSSFPGLCL